MAAVQREIYTFSDTTKQMHDYEINSYLDGGKSDQVHVCEDKNTWLNESSRDDRYIEISNDLQNSRYITNISSKKKAIFGRYIVLAITKDWTEAYKKTLMNMSRNTLFTLEGDLLEVETHKEEQISVEYNGVRLSSLNRKKLKSGDTIRVLYSPDLDGKWKELFKFTYHHMVVEPPSSYIVFLEGMWL